IIQDIPRDALWRAEGRAAVGRIDEEDWRLDVIAIVRVKDEARPSDVNAVLKLAARMRVHSDPRLVVKRRRRRCRVDERRWTPGQVAAAVKRAFINGFGVRCAGPVEGIAYVKDVALAVERKRRVTAGIIRTSDQMLDTWNQRSDLARVGSRCVVRVWITVAAPCRTAVVRV